MSINLTDEQIVRVLDLCTTIARLRQDLPRAPQGFDVDLEVAKHLRLSLEARNSDLLELAALLR